NRSIRSDGSIDLLEQRLLEFVLVQPALRSDHWEPFRRVPELDAIVKPGVPLSQMIRQSIRDAPNGIAELGQAMGCNFQLCALPRSTNNRVHRRHGREREALEFIV